ncbi:MAG: hypothetical protein KDA44_17700 [Planctomycetales bacterium]|nr:hypothetical protein [Planctomycetales bacterium]
MLTQSPQKYQEVLQVAERLFRQDPDWVTFFREVLGIEGSVRQTFPSFDELTAFEQSEEYAKIQKMVVKLREKRPTAEGEGEPTRVITVRLPASMHEYLKSEAHDMRTSMNKLCISKLLQVIGEDQIPNDRTTTPPKATVVRTAASPSLSNGLHTTPTSPTGYAQPQSTGQPQTPPPFKPTQPRF